MDPSTTLQNLIEALTTITKVPDDTAVCNQVDDADEALEALESWHSRRGFLPTWPKDRDLVDDNPDVVIAFHLGRLSMSLDSDNRDGYASALAGLRSVVEAL